MKLTGISACVFDAYGTIFDLDSVVMACRDVLGDKVGPLSDLWRRKQLEYSWLRSLMGRHADFARVTADALDYALKAQGIADGELATKLRQAYLTLPPYGDAAAALTALRQTGRRTAILSNGSPAMLDPMVKKSGLAPLLDMLLSIEDVGVFKPHPKVYALACDRLALPAAQIAFVSANGWDAAGAAAFGFTVAWLNRRAEPEELLPAKPSATIASLAELPALFGAGA